MVVSRFILSRAAFVAEAVNVKARDIARRKDAPSYAQTQIALQQALKALESGHALAPMLLKRSAEISWLQAQQAEMEGDNRKADGLLESAELQLKHGLRRAEQALELDVIHPDTMGLRKKLCELWEYRLRFEGVTGLAVTALATDKAEILYSQDGVIVPLKDPIEVAVLQAGLLGYIINGTGYDMCFDGWRPLTAHLQRCWDELKAQAIPVLVKARMLLRERIGAAALGDLFSEIRQYFEASCDYNVALEESKVRCNNAHQHLPFDNPLLSHLRNEMHSLESKLHHCQYPHRPDR